MNAQQIKELREKMQLSRYEFAKLFEVVEKTVYYWETGKSTPYYKYQRKLAELEEKYKEIKE